MNGSHHIYGKPGSVVRLSIPIHGNKALKTGLLRNLLKAAEIDEGEIVACGPLVAKRCGSRPRLVQIFASLHLGCLLHAKVELAVAVPYALAWGGNCHVITDSNC